MLSNIHVIECLKGHGFEQGEPNHDIAIEVFQKSGSGWFWNSCFPEDGCLPTGVIGTFATEEEAIANAQGNPSS